MVKFKVEMHIPGAYEEKIIECERHEIMENCYCFWIAVHGKSRLVASYPIHYTVVREIIEENEN